MFPRLCLQNGIDLVFLKCSGCGKCTDLIILSSNIITHFLVTLNGVKPSR